MGADNCMYCFAVGMGCKDIIDSNSCDGELNCFADGCLNARKIIFSHFMRNCSEVSYSMFCFNSQNLFGCTGLNRKQYCIFNKQYTKEEYEKLVARIAQHMQKTGEWGKYFPATLSAFGYNETFAYDMEPISKDEAINRGFKWADYKQEVGVGEGDYVVCEVTGRPFRLIKQEIEFYKKQGIPLPRVHPDVRIERRYRVRNPNKFWRRACGKCGKNVVTTYDPKRPGVVYCEKCFLEEVY